MKALLKAQWWKIESLKNAKQQFYENCIPRRQWNGFSSLIPLFRKGYGMFSRVSIAQDKLECGMKNGLRWWKRWWWCQYRKTLFLRRFGGGKIFLFSSSGDFMLEPKGAKKNIQPLYVALLLFNPQTHNFWSKLFECIFAKLKNIFRIFSFMFWEKCAAF